MALSINLAWLEAVMLALVRMVAFLVVAPPFSHRAVPARVKVAVALGLGLAVSPRVTDGYVSLDTAGFVGALALEILVGAALGFLVMLIFAAITSAGTLIDLFGGFSMAQVYDPQSMVNGAQFARLYAMAATVLMFASDSYQLIIGGLVRTFDALPLGGGQLALLGQGAIGKRLSLFESLLDLFGEVFRAGLVLAEDGLISRPALVLGAARRGSYRHGLAPFHLERSSGSTAGNV